ncbi:DUF2306 domain-containing protein [Ruegeria arenilitoris]|uniref:DUF2306 domain-containing protein n=1 Tax=Ruegeria arenilitoris TaxID=1173585 RepID=UPI00147D03F6|nr:DUF2306 domain-containing protein [Ruegeria arenilitoris]
MWLSKSGIVTVVILTVFYLTLLPFLAHAFELITVGLSAFPWRQTYLFAADQSVGNAAMMLHITAGSVLVALVPLQMVGRIRLRNISFHRGIGSLLVVLALTTGLAGMVYIPLRGTIGGPLMSAAFFIYGFCLFTAALMLARMVFIGNRQGHWEWALRLFWLALGSWLYRVHYTLWYLLTGGLWSEPDFSGSFDLIQNFAFYLPYLVAVQFWIVAHRDAHQGTLPKRLGAW